jgi:anthranilate synthase/aminodeoxychorismate synthase-like glutamine amidotransferase
MIDNYDSFTYNLVQSLGALGAEVRVYRNDKISVAEIESTEPEAVVISPGPGTPKEAGISIELIRRLHTAFPILGVCLGHQAVAEAFGARIVRAGRIMHGKTSMIEFGDSPLYKGIKSPAPGGRYHSLAVDKNSIPGDLIADSFSEDGEIMGIRHTAYPVHGVQFHPESILTPCGKRLMRNFLEIAAHHGKREKGETKGPEGKNHDA